MVEGSRIKVGFVGFGEVNSPRDLIEQKCVVACQMPTVATVIATAPVSDDPEQIDERRAIAELGGGLRPARGLRRRLDSVPHGDRRHNPLGAQLNGFCGRTCPKLPARCHGGPGQ